MSRKQAKLILHIPTNHKNISTNHKDIYRKKMRHKTSEQIELEKHCTFTPKFEAKYKQNKHPKYYENYSHITRPISPQFFSDPESECSPKTNKIFTLQKSKPMHSYTSLYQKQLNQKPYKFTFSSP
eukprot:376050_1